MTIIITWLTLLGGALGIELFGRLTGRQSSLAHIATSLWAWPPGRLILLAVWAFAGWHVFARYTVPG